MKSSYITSLTPMRGIAAIWVMLFHIDVIIFYRDFGSLISHDGSGIISKGYLWVDFFFLLSGFVISHVYGATLTDNFGKLKAIKSYLWARFTRIYPLHLFTLLLLIPLAVVFPIISPKVVDGSWQTFFAWSALSDNVLLINSMNQHTYLSWNILSWSIGAEWWAYVAACFVIPFVFQKSWIRSALVSIIGISIMFGLVNLKGNLDITFDYGWARCLGEFSLGVVLYQIYQKSIGKSWLSNSIAFIISMVIVILIFHFKWNDLFIIPTFAILLLATSFNNGIVKATLEHKLFKYLGDISYSIYLMHGVWFMAFWNLLPYLRSVYGIDKLDASMKFIYVILFIGLTVVSSHYSYRYIEVKFRAFLGIKES